MKKIEVLDLWIKEPPMRLISEDKGKTWKQIPIPFYPFVSKKETSYILEKKIELRKD